MDSISTNEKNKTPILDKLLEGCKFYELVGICAISLCLVIELILFAFVPDARVGIGFMFLCTGCGLMGTIGMVNEYNKTRK